MIFSDEERQAFDALFECIYKGDKDAKALSFEILELVHIWDDLYDKDRDVPPEEVNKAFFSAIYGLQSNRMYQACNLGVHMLNVILRWQDANVLECENKIDDDLNKAYMLRAGVYDLFPVIAYHIHGMEWAQHIGPAVRRFYGETLNEFKKEVRSCRAGA